MGKIVSSIAINMSKVMTSKTFTNVKTSMTCIKIIESVIVRELSEKCGIICGVVQSILIENWGMRRAFAKLVPKLLSADQKEGRLSLGLLECAENEENFLK
ncbi:hypothetical protein AVEN_218676-1 [Araneus ventricosus]|uniref:Uncharacterized protein n=1 Tax=Araneus ventricosus TaxID=182803 RepID=A0A4Y2B6K2_ARAVE|nr:hypothetical protein AVEN_218676-1 [Araneus ventricosus]